MTETAAKPAPAKPAPEKPEPAATPAAVVAGYHHFGGKHAETAALKNVLAHAGVTAPHTGKPYTEELLLGLGGGIGGGYVLYEMCNRPWLVLGFRHMWHDIHGKYLQSICKRIGARATVKEVGGAKVALANLKQALAQGHPAIAWVGMAGLPYHALPIAYLKGYAYVVVVYGLDDAADQAYLGDTAGAAVTTTAQELAIARAAIGSLKNRLLIVEPPAKPPELKKAVIEGIREGCRALLRPPMANFGLSAFDRWAEMVANPKEKKGWPTVLRDTGHFYTALTQAFRYIETSGTGGGAFRSMYGDFLDEAKELIGKSAMRQLARQYRDLGAQWSAFAAACLPDWVREFRQTRDALVKMDRLYHRRPMATLPERQKLYAQVEDEAELRKKFPMTPEQRMEFLARLREQLLALHRAEVAAAAALQQAVA